MIEFLCLLEKAIKNTDGLGWLVSIAANVCANLVEKWELV